MSHKERYGQQKLNPSGTGINFRLLDFDDLYLLRHLLEGLTVAGTARKLGLTQPAITQRIRKIERVFEDSIIKKVGRHVQLTPTGESICSKAADALAVMKELSGAISGDQITLASEGYLAASHIWPALSDAMMNDPSKMVHLRISPDRQAMALLTEGHVDGLVTTSEQPNANLSSIKLFEEEHIFVASPDLAPSITDVSQLEEIRLIELDPSYPSMQYLTLEARSDIKFSDIWFVGDRSLVINSVIKGLGVGIVPASMAKAQISAGKLVAILPDLELKSETYQLIYKEAKVLEQLQPLIERLKSL
jgi:DNA-binding transcriptional LysR family regulator